jgi:hypothetical protein
VSESGEKDVFERMVERVLAYRPKSKRKKKKRKGKRVEHAEKKTGRKVDT